MTQPHDGSNTTSGDKDPRVIFLPRDGDGLVVRLTGHWNLAEGLLSTDSARREIEGHPTLKTVSFEAWDLAGWDSSLLSYLVQLHQVCVQKNLDVEWDRLPEGLRKLLVLATAVPESKEARRREGRSSLLRRIREGLSGIGLSALEMVEFIGEVWLSLVRLVRGKARFRPSDLGYLIQECGANALPIVSLISVLVGVILAYVGAIQLRLFGAQIYVADLVGLGMAREMGAMMTAIIMAGRTGAAFAAQLGTMQVNEEIDALKTLGISPMEFLVLPRMIALVIMLPPLCLYADLMGILGGALVGIGTLDLSPLLYFNETQSAVELQDFLAGLVKAAVFGALIAVSGCLRGMQCGRSASAVGEAATSAVVTAIVFIIVSDAILTVIYDIIGL
ncbi:MAG TPA: ABC transporter permease [Syntrophobacteraceae bacterium]|nr:ABC transporter permease [Syntrophobacteraceae bacterium]